MLLIYIGYRIVKAMIGGKENRPEAAHTRDEAEVTHRDPVCGVYVSERDAVVGRLEGQRHYFCSMTCLEKFREQLDHTPS
ncbi:MAG: YHS domain-containing protein [Deltaproteobacteria bacterium]|nr:YHS domain-containing protein [Deltaproteobacteria bacterium]